MIVRHQLGKDQIRRDADRHGDPRTGIQIARCLQHVAGCGIWPNHESGISGGCDLRDGGGVSRGEFPCGLCCSMNPRQKHGQGCPPQDRLDDRSLRLNLPRRWSRGRRWSVLRWSSLSSWLLGVPLCESYCCLNRRQNDFPPNPPQCRPVC